MPTASENRVRVLMIEDNPLHSRLIEKLLQESRGPEFELAVATTLADGLARLAAGDHDLVLLDLTLPDSHDLETFIRVRAAAPNLPVVVVTSQDDLKLA